jgi:hypothetical protein
VPSSNPPGDQQELSDVAHHPNREDAAGLMFLPALVGFIKPVAADLRSAATQQATPSRGPCERQI